MNRTALVVLGVVLVLLGAVWTLQGLNVIGGSGMSGHAIWAVIGPVVAIVGLVLLFRSRRPAA